MNPTLETLLGKYPQRNKEWDAHSDRGTPCFYTEASDLAGGGDPWDRPLPQEYTVVRDGEGEVMYWEHVTTVAGQKVLLRIYND